jgi:hypothetical protein
MAPRKRTQKPDLIIVIAYLPEKVACVVVCGIRLRDACVFGSSSVRLMRAAEQTALIRTTGPFL